MFVGKRKKVVTEENRAKEKIHCISYSEIKIHILRKSSETRNATNFAAIAASIHFIIILERTCVIFGQINEEYCSRKACCLVKQHEIKQVIRGVWNYSYRI